jgi:anti-anti-sigma regulatory factor
MSLNTLQLTGAQVADLFSSSLVLTGEETAVSQVSTPASIQFLGKNSRRFVVLVQYSDAVHISDAAFEFLGSVLKACQLNAADIAIVNLAKQNPDLKQLSEELSPAVLLNFTTIVPAGCPSDLPQLSPTLFNTIHYMTAPALDQLNQPTEAVKPLKRQLWEGLKTMLGI